MKQYLVLDTNIILLDHQNIIALGQDHTIVIPEIVVEEIDNKKTSPGELGFQARAFGRLIASAKVNTIARGDLIKAKLKLGNIDIEIASSPSYPKDCTNNDRKIIYIASCYLKSIFMSNDVACRIQAMAKGIQVTDLKEVEKTSFEFIRKLEVTQGLFSTLHNRQIAEVDADYKLENYNYLFTNLETNQTKLGVIQNGVIDIIGKTTEAELRKQDVNPINTGQIFMSKAIQDPAINIVITEAKSGSGKTLCAISNAIALTKRNPYQAILYVRNTVDDIGTPDEEIGFLPGAAEKLEPYLHPFFDSLDFIARAKFKSKKHGRELDLKVDEEVQLMQKKYNMQPMVALGTRGRTFHDSIIIIDEAQNISPATMQKLLTRVGKNCKVIIIGSLSQIDSKYLNRYTSSLAHLLKSTTEPQPITIAAVELNTIVRGPVALYAETLFSA